MIDQNWPKRRDPHRPNPGAGKNQESIPTRYGVEIKEVKLPKLDLEKIMRQTFK